MSGTQKDSGPRTHDSIDQSDLMFWPQGNANYSVCSSGNRVLIFSQLDDLERGIRRQAAELAQLSGWLRDLDADPGLVLLIDH